MSLLEKLNKEEFEFKKHFCSLFVADSRDAYFVNILDPNIANSRNRISIKDKVNEEINEAIIRLVRGEKIPGSNSQSYMMLENETARIRTICLLLGLQHYLNNECPTLIDKLEHSPWPADHKEKHVHHWQLSKALLLVKAVTLSQWEWETQDYCFEHFSACRAREYLGVTLTNTDIITIPKTTKIAALCTLTRLVRWQSLQGQYERGTATFGIEDLPQIDDFEKQMLWAITYADCFLRSANHDNESAISAAVKRIHNIDHHDIDIPSYFKKNVTDITYPFYSKTTPFSCEKFDLRLDLGSPNSKLANALNRLKKECPNNNDLDVLNSALTQKYIFSYWALHTITPTDTSEIKLANQFLHDIMVKLAHKVSSAEISHESNITHIILRRSQSDLGLIPALYEKYKNDTLDKILRDIDVTNSKSLYEKYKNVSLDKIFSYIDEINSRFLPELDCVLKEKLYIINFKPSFLVGVLYSKCTSPSIKITDKSPVTFLQSALSALRSECVILLPLVKRMTDLLVYYDSETNKDYKVFPVQITFDHGDKKIDIWLPEDIKGAEQAFLNRTSDCEDITVETILSRYLNHIITNYGMTHGYHRVDIDFSASIHYKPGEEHPWQKAMAKCNHDYGVHVFDTYLQHCSEDILEKSYGKERYVKVIERRKAAQDHCFDSICDLELADKYLMGIDVGATGIKLQLFKIITSTQAATNGCYQLARHDSTTYFLTPDESRTISTHPQGMPPYKDGDAFATYIYRMASRFFGEDKLNNVISIGISWPGPIRQNLICASSGILKNFENPLEKGTPFKGQAGKDNYDEVRKINIGKSIRTTFKKPAALCNDGDAEAIGFAFANASTTEANYARGLKQILRDNGAVAIIKGGTGTAGSILIDGNLHGLNEFGKVIVDLGTKKDPDWPQGDANKCFSLRFLRSEVRGSNKIEEDDIGGWDLTLIELANSNITTKNILLKFGALELAWMADPTITYSDVIQTITEECISTATLTYSSQDGYRIASKSDAKQKIGPVTWNRLVGEQKLTDINLGEDIYDFTTLLVELGKHRIKRLKLHNLKPDLAKIGAKMGCRLADLVALLYDIHPLQAVTFAGGVIKNTTIQKNCITAFEERIECYLRDRSTKNLVQNISPNQPEKPKKSENHVKLVFTVEEEDNALLGTAILGFDYYVEEQKTKELQQFVRNINTDKEEGKPSLALNTSRRYLKEEELRKFIAQNAVKLKISLNKDGKINKV